MVLVKTDTESTSNPNTMPKVAWGGAGMVPTVKSPNQPGPWAPTSNTTSTNSFRDIQSEDLAHHLSNQLNGYSSNGSPEAVQGPSEFDCEAFGVEDTSNDLALAQSLQYEFDLEHDVQIDLYQRQTNKNSKLCINYDNHKILPSFDRRLYELPPDEGEPIDVIEAGELDEPHIPACGYLQQDGIYVTKHNSDITARRNTKKMLHHLPLQVNTGDAGGFAINMNNKVYNNLNGARHSACKRKQRKHDKAEKGTFGRHIDNSASNAIIELTNSGVLERVSGIISTGKEAVVHQAVYLEEESEVEKDCVVKIFKTTLTDFKNRTEYIADDHRFTNRMAKTNSLNNLKLWVEKEYRNLRRIHNANISSPVPLVLKRTMVIMSFIGNDEGPAPQLKSIQLPLDKLETAYDMTMQIVDDLLHKCRLVHGDLSEYNLLYHDKQVYVIDVAQAVDITHPHALSLLYRDLCNVANFFYRRGLTSILTGVEALEKITGLKIVQSPELSNHEQIEAVEQQLDKWRSSSCYSDKLYDFLWQTSELQRQFVERKSDNLSRDMARLEVSERSNNYNEEWLAEKPDGVLTPAQIKKRKKKTKYNTKINENVEGTPNVKEAKSKFVEEESKKVSFNLNSESQTVEESS